MRQGRKPPRAAADLYPLFRELQNRRDPEEIFTEICRLICESFSIERGWFGIAVEPCKTLKLKGTFNIDQDFMKTVEETIAFLGKPNLKEPLIANGSRDAGGKTSLPFIKGDIKSCAIFPVSTGHPPHGCLALYSSKKDAFTRDTVASINTILLFSSEIIFSMMLENSLRASHEELKDKGDALIRVIRHWISTFDTIKEMIIILDQDWRVIRVNKAVSEHLGMSYQAILGKTVESLFPDLPLLEISRTGSDEIVEHEVQDYHREKYYFLSKFPHYSPEKEYLGSIVILRDITEEKRLRLHLFQSEKLSAIGEILAGVAHELNNPLAGVVGFAQLALEFSRDEGIRDSLETIKGEAERAVKIVKNLLTFARRKKPQKNPFELKELIEKSIALRAYELKVKNIKLALSIPDGLPMLYGDFQQLQQVFLNLILHAEKSILTSEGEGKLSISARHDTQKEIVVVEFFDSGKPVPEENLTRIFDPYFKTTEGNESGLGLAIAYGIVGDHQGRLMLRNLPVKGKVFTLELPAYMGSVEAVEKSPINADNGAMIRGRKILVVDDDESICNLIKNIIEKEGGVVRTANDASEALGRVLEERFDLIICDIKMPGMSGIELAGNLISSSKIERGNIILLTGDTLSQETQNQIESSGLTAMIKPFNISELKLALGGKTQ